MRPVHAQSGTDAGLSSHIGAVCCRAHPKKPGLPRHLAGRGWVCHRLDARPDADPHANGTIWGAALWDLRSRLSPAEGALATDLLLLQALLLLGRLQTRRSSFPVGLAALLHADELLHAARHRAIILDTFAVRGILPEPAALRALQGGPVDRDRSVSARGAP